jgi:3-hydroxyisobutyrate dehydrogenase-like beta-hydroxyacid dehydrogenase
MAARLTAGGHEVTGWNRTPRGLQPATAADAVAGADVVLSMVTDGAALAELYAAARSGLRPGGTWVDCSTVGPEAIGRFPEAVAAPVLGSVAEAEAGTLTVLAGGPPGAVERVRPVLQTLGTVLEVGDARAAAAAKLAANAGLFGVVAVLAETLALLDRAGVERETAFAVLARTPLAEQAARRRPAIEAGEYPPRFALRHARKDAELARDRALPVLGAVATWLEGAQAAGLGDRDHVALAGHILARAAAAG